MSSSPIVSSPYVKLVANIRQEIALGLQRAQELLEQQKILTYWSVGRLIRDYLTREPLERGAITFFYERLAKELNISIRMLQHFEQFYRYFPQKKFDPSLNWSQYRALLVIPDKQERLRWIKRIKKEKISSRDLQILLSKEYGLGIEHAPEALLKTPVRGKLYTYKLVSAAKEDFPWYVDCGFSNRLEAPPSGGTLHNRFLYRSVKVDKTYSLKATDTKVEELYTFKAGLERIVDADTPVVTIDQGFGMRAFQRLRLKGIDAPEIGTLAGKRSKMWVEKELEGLSFIIVKTYKSDKYDRYLVDVFYLKDETDPERVAREGLWLNARMVAQGHAKMWNEKDFY